MNVLSRPAEVGYVARRLRRPADRHLGGLARGGGQGRRPTRASSELYVVSTPGMPGAVGRPSASSSCWTAAPAVAAAAPDRPGRHRGGHLHLRHDRPAEGRRAHPLPAAHELRHARAAVRHPRRRRRPRRRCRCSTSSASPACSTSASASARRCRWCRASTPPRSSRSSSATGSRCSRACRRCTSRCSTTRTSTKYDLASLRVGISGGAPIPAEVLDAFERRVRRRDPRGLRAVRDARRRRRSTSAPTSAGSTASASRSGASRCEIWDDAGHVLPPGRRARRRDRRARA